MRGGKGVTETGPKARTGGNRRRRCSDVLYGFDFLKTISLALLSAFDRLPPDRSVCSRKPVQTRSAHPHSDSAEALNARHGPKPGLFCACRRRMLPRDEAARAMLEAKGTVVLGLALLCGRTRQRTR